MINQEIKIDSPLAKELGFISDKFDGYLWQINDTIIISFIISKHEGKGNLKKLFQTIKDKGFKKIKVPTPFARMKYLCEKWGFKEIYEDDKVFGAVQIMEKSL
jgi:hypothetical protein